MLVAGFVGFSALGRAMKVETARQAEGGGREGKGPGRLSLLLFGVHIRGFPKIRGAFLGVPIRRIRVFWGLYWGPPILGRGIYGWLSTLESLLVVP